MATLTHIEQYRVWMDEPGLAPATVDRRPSAVCGDHRFAHIDGRIGSNGLRVSEACGANIESLGFGAAFAGALTIRPCWL